MSGLPARLAREARHEMARKHAAVGGFAWGRDLFEMDEGCIAAAIRAALTEAARVAREGQRRCAIEPCSVDIAVAIESLRDGSASDRADIPSEE